MLLFGTIHVPYVMHNQTYFQMGEDMFMFSRRSFMTSALGAAVGVLTKGAQTTNKSVNPLLRFPGKEEKWKRSWDLATTTLAENTLQLGPYARPVLTEGSQYPGIWMECAPTEALVNLRRREYLPEQQRESRRGCDRNAHGILRTTAPGWPDTGVHPES